MGLSTILHLGTSAFETDTIIKMDTMIIIEATLHECTRVFEAPSPLSPLPEPPPDEKSSDTRTHQKKKKKRPPPHIR